MDLAEQSIIDQFVGIYGGGKAQRLRDAGQSDAMPPWAETYWLGKQVVKCPMDLWVYQEIIWETKPDLIIETGTSGAGSAWFFAHVLDALGNGSIITVDKDSYPHLCLAHPRIQYLVGDSISGVIAEQIRAAAVGKRVMVSLDSLHTYEHVARELALYGPLVTPGCYLVVEDTGLGGDGAGGDWCTRAAAEFVAANPGYEIDKSRERHLLTSNRDGWIRRIS
jgi:cephalosporin hydroxylase